MLIQRNLSKCQYELSNTALLSMIWMSRAKDGNGWIPKSKSTTLSFASPRKSHGYRSIPTVGTTQSMDRKSSVSYDRALYYFFGTRIRHPKTVIRISSMTVKIVKGIWSGCFTSALVDIRCGPFPHWLGMAGQSGMWKQTRKKCYREWMESAKLL